MHPRAAIDRYLAEGLPVEDETTLRDHLRSCAECRDHYDRQVLLYRALAGDPDAPTAAERERTLRLTLQRAGLAPPEPKPAARAGLWDRLLWAPAPALGLGAALVAALVVGAIWLARAPSADRSATTEPVVAAHVKEGRGLVLDGAPLGPKAARGAAVLAGRGIEVGQGGIAELTLVRGGAVRVFPGTRLLLFGKGDGVLLSGGKVWCLVKSGGRPFLVRTDVAEAVVLGTSFLVEENQAGETDVRVVEGTVEVRNVEGGEAVRVQGGRQTHVAAAAPPNPPRRYDPDPDISDWESFWREFTDGFKRAMRRLGDLLEGK